MPVQVQCPHCATPCMVGEQHFGAMVNCGRCGQPFMVRSANPPPAIPVATPQGGPAGKPGQPNISNTLRGVFKSLMPFSKVEGVEQQVVYQQASARQVPPVPAATPPPAAPPAGIPAAVPVEEEEDDVELDFGPGVAQFLQSSPPPAAAPAPAPVSGAAASQAAWTPPRATSVLRLDIGGATHTGMSRKRNEDSFLVQQFTWSNFDQRHELALIVVADGMGGHEAGDKASQIAIQSIGAGLSSLVTGMLTGQTKDTSVPALSAALETAIKNANQAVYRRAQNDQSCRGMGATVAVVLIWNGQVTIGHVGDCRVYGFRGGKINQLTRDQTLVEKMVKLGQLRPDEAANHPARNEVAQAVGRQPDVEPAAYQLKLVLGDWLIVACDGLHAHIDSGLLEKVVRESAPSGTHLAHQLVELTNIRGGTDNTTVVAVRVY